MSEGVSPAMIRSDQGTRGRPAQFWWVADAEGCPGAPVNLQNGSTADYVYTSSPPTSGRAP
jgi:hypothetical protein